MLATTLRHKGYEVSAVERGLDAVIQFMESIKEGRCFDVLVLDCALPQMDGFSVAEHIRLTESQGVTDCHPWIAAYTAYSKTVEKTTLIEKAGIDAYFVKGEDEGKLVEQIANWLSEVKTL